MLAEPARFFAGLGGPRPDRVKEPIIFAIICALLSTPFAFFLQRYDPLAPRQPDMVSGFTSMFRDNPAAAIALAVLLVVLLPLFAVLGVYIGAAIQHLFVLLFVRERRGYWGTFPVVAYGSALSLFSWIPVVGYLISLYGIYVTTVGLREMHGTTTPRALLAALVPSLFGLAGVISSLLAPFAGGS